MIGDLGQPGRQRVCMQRPHRGQRTKHDQIERALEELDLVVFTGHSSEDGTVSTWVSSGRRRHSVRTEFGRRFAHDVPTDSSAVFFRISLDGFLRTRR